MRISPKPSGYHNLSVMVVLGLRTRVLFLGTSLLYTLKFYSLVTEPRVLRLGSKIHFRIGSSMGVVSKDEVFLSY